LLQIRHADGVEELSFPEFEDAVRAGRIGPLTPLRFEPVTGDAFRPAGELELFRSVLDNPRTRFERRFTLRRPPAVTATLAVILFAAFLWQLQSAPLDVPALLAQGAKSLEHQRFLGQWWRLATAPLLHVSWIHLGTNLAFIGYLGWNVEAILGRASTLLLYVAAGIGSMLASTWATTSVAVGASGVTFALFGAAIAVGWRFGEWLPRPVRVRYGWAVLPFLTWFLVIGAMWDTVDNFCHLGGLLIGGALALALPASLEERSSGWSAAGRGALAAALVFATTVIAPTASRMGIGTAPALQAAYTSREPGYSLRPPARWTELRTEGQPPSWSSPTGLARLSVRSWVDDATVPDPEAVRRRWVQELEQRAVVVPHSTPEPASLGLPEAWFTLETDVISADGVLRSLRVGRIRGLYVTTVEFLHAEDHFAAYAPLRERVLTSMQLQAPRAVERAAEAILSTRLPAAELEPGIDRAIAEGPRTTPAASLRLAAELGRYGDRERARALLDALLLRAPDAPEVLHWDLWVDHHLGGGADGVERAEALLLRAPDSLQSTALAFDVLLAADQRGGARRVLDRLRRQWPDASATRRRAALLPPSMP
jgi:membrane associated rhomboid family serine protease